MPHTHGIVPECIQSHPHGQDRALKSTMTSCSRSPASSLAEERSAERRRLNETAALGASAMHFEWDGRGAPVRGRSGPRGPVRRVGRSRCGFGVAHGDGSLCSQLPCHGIIPRGGGGGMELPRDRPRTVESQARASTVSGRDLMADRAGSSRRSLPARR